LGSLAIPKINGKGLGGLLMLAASMGKINLNLLQAIDTAINDAILRGERSAVIWLNPTDNIEPIRPLLLARKFSIVVTKFEKLEIFW
jgi:hypothetical protein